MIDKAYGNLLQADAEALVNTVNCIGYMGKGIALQFKQAFPDNFKSYEKACHLHEIKPGHMFIYTTGSMLNPKYIVNFPTKRHWRGKSRLEDIKSGLNALIKDVKRLGICSIAVPPLGCGNGGLDWAVVRPMIESAFSMLPDVRVLLYAPHGAPDAKTMPVATKYPVMTPARALFIKLMEQYSALDYRRTLLEVQKLAYFLQEAGEPLRLKYEAGHFGPYATNLNKVLERIEGHFIRGYGDSQKPDTEIELMPGVVDKADKLIADLPESQERLKRVSELINGFETPYGMELLATVHWVTQHPTQQGSNPACDSGAAVKAVHNWNVRKKRTFKSEHVRVAWLQLAEQGWICKKPEIQGHH